MTPEPASGDRGSYVRQLFTHIVPRYDLMNTLITQGRDQRWRKRAAQASSLPQGGLALDVATGTGKQALALLDQGAGRVVGIDFSLAMLHRAHQQVSDPRASFALADAQRLPFADDSFDAVVSSFLIRNVNDIELAFAEQLRVAKPGSRIVCLEIALPPPGWTGNLFRFYFFRVVPLVGGLVTGHQEAYRYLPDSLKNFPSPVDLAAIMGKVGLRQVHYQLWAGGSISLHVGLKD